MVILYVTVWRDGRICFSLDSCFNVHWWWKVIDLFYMFVCCCVVGKAAPGASINVQVIQHIEHAEGEISAALTLFDIFVDLVVLAQCTYNITVCSTSSPSFDIVIFYYCLYHNVLVSYSGRKGECCQKAVKNTLLATQSRIWTPAGAGKSGQ